MTADLAGSFPALVTPMLSPGELDLDGFSTLIDRAMQDGAIGVLVAGSTGEGTLLAPSDRRALTAAARTAASNTDGMTVIATASGATLHDLHADVDRLAGAGADVVLVLAPHCLPLRAEELVAAHVAIADAAAAPTLVYHIPQFTGAALTPEAVTDLATHDGIVGMKDSSDDTQRRAAFVAAAGHGFAVLTGHGPSMARALEDGVTGAITAVGNVRQRQVVALLAAVRDGDDTATTQLQRSIAGCEADLRGIGRSMPAALKAALQLEGVIAERWCTPPLESVPPPRLDQVRTALMR